MRFSCNSRRLLIALAAACLGHALAFPGAAKAGLLDDLFGALFNPHSYRGYDAYPPPAPGQDIRRKANRGRLGLGQSSAARKRAAAAARIGQPVRLQGSVDLMEDDSLRKGDAVVTPAGIRVFTGYSSDRHKPEDFKRPSEIKGLAKSERKALAALDAQGAAAGRMSALVTGRSAAGRKLSAGELITDARGRTIRYVGP